MSRLEVEMNGMIQEMQDKLFEESNNRDNEFVEALMFSKDKGVIMKGRWGGRIGMLKDEGDELQILRWARGWKSGCEWNRGVAQTVVLHSCRGYWQD